MRENLEDTFNRSHTQLENLNNAPSEERQQQRQLRFSANRLATLGLEAIHNQLASILCEAPWRVDQRFFVNSLAYQGYEGDLRRVIDFHSNSQTSTNKYMRAITIRALANLPALNQDIYFWELIVNLSLEGTDIERLMATETWLISERNPADSPVNLEQIKTMQALATSEDLSVRLRKNYLLIIGLYDNARGLGIDWDTIGTENEPLLQRAHRIARDGNAGSIFSKHEPDILRRRYYSGKYRDDSAWTPS